MRCAGLSPSRPPLLRSTGSRRAGSVVVAHGPSCSTACGIFPDLGSNPCPLHWQADSQPLRHQGSPVWEDFDYELNFFDSRIRSSDSLLLLDLVLLSYVFQGLFPFHLSNQHYYEGFFPFTISMISSDIISFIPYVDNLCFFLFLLFFTP